LHYNAYVKHVGFSIKIASSRRSAKDDEKDKTVVICKKNGKLVEIEATPLKERNKSLSLLITKLRCASNIMAPDGK
jgi:hypothetical protein